MEEKGIGFSKEDILTILSDKTFQKTIKIFAPNKLFEFLRGVGFLIAIFAGVFGYYLSWDSEKDDRKAAHIQDIIDRKVMWMRQVNKGVMDIRKTRYLIKLDCDYDKHPSPYTQARERFMARYNLVNAFTGINEIYNEQVFIKLRELTAFDESIQNICASNAPTDEAWRKLLLQLNNLMKKSIMTDRMELKSLSEGGLNKIWDKL